MRLPRFINNTPFQKPIKLALTSLSEFFESSDNESALTDPRLKSILSLLGAVLWANGQIKEKELVEIRKYLATQFSHEESNLLVQYLQRTQENDIGDAVEELKNIPASDKEAIIRVLLEVAYADNEITPKEESIIKSVNESFGYDEAHLCTVTDSIRETRQKKENFLKSSTGIIAAIVIILIFVLTATFLKSVLFGLILAYFFLPLEKWFENRFLNYPLVKSVINRTRLLLKPVNALKSWATHLFMKKNQHAVPAFLLSDQQQEQEQQNQVQLACHATMLTVVLGILVFFCLLFGVSVPYITRLGLSVKSWADKTVQEVETPQQGTATPSSEKLNTESASGQKPGKDSHQASSITDQQGKDSAQASTLPTAAGASETDRAGNKAQGYLGSLLKGVMQKIEALKPRLEKLPLFAWAKKSIASYINNADNRRQLFTMALNRSGGVFSYTAGFISSLGVFVFNIVLTFFFFSFFLQKIAAFNTRQAKNSSQDGDYLVTSIFQSSWMPYLDNKTMEETREIINTIFFKLKTWVRSYLSIIIIETTIYVSAFFLMGVPYTPLLGFIAGCTILLPFLGPIASCILTIVVTLAVAPGTSMVFILMIISLYVLMNGIIEQLFLYPALAGEALGLNTLETIIVVLLGGLFAGIPGMIFAVPATSILKYLIPKIYECWR